MTVVIPTGARVIDIDLDTAETNIFKNVPYETHEQFYSTDIGMAFLKFTGLAQDYTGCTARLTLINFNDGSKVQRIFEMDTITTFVYPMLETELVHAGRWIGQLTVIKGGTTISDNPFRFKINGPIMNTALISFDNVNTFTDQLTTIYDGLNTFLDAVILEEYDRATAEGLRVVAEGLRVTAEELRETAEDTRQTTFEANEIIRDGIVNSLVTAETIAQKVAEKYQLIEAESADRLLSVEQQLAQAKKKGTDWINVVEMGISNDGVTDVADALQALINSVPEFSVLFFPSGVYRLSHGIVLNRNVSIVGNHTGQYAWSSVQDTFSCLSLDVGVTNTTVLSVTTATKRRFIRDIMIASQSAAFSKTNLVPVAGSPNHLYQLTINDVGVTGLDISTLLGISIENVMIKGCSAYGVKCGIVNYLRNVTTFECGTGYLVDKDNRIDQPFVSACTVGIEVVGANNNITGGWVDQIITYGLLIKSGRNKMDINFDQIGYAAIKTTGDLTMSHIVALVGRVGQYYAGTYLASLTEAEYSKACALHNAFKIYGCTITLSVPSLIGNDAGTAGLCPAVKMVNATGSFIERSVMQIPNSGESATDFSVFAFVKNLGSITASHLMTGGTNESRYSSGGLSTKSAIFANGSGVPSMSGYAGTFYLDTNTNFLYANIYGGTTWTKIVV